MGNKNLQTDNCPCKKTDCQRWGQCDICREYHYSKRKKTFCERKKYLKSIGEFNRISAS
jgi:hypothetical protein